jgi:hypothetical protein
MSGQSVTEASGPAVVTLRSLAQVIRDQGAERFAGEILGPSGAGSFEIPPATEDGTVSSLQGRFALPSRRDILAGNAFDLPLGLAVMPRPGDGPAGPLWLERLSAAEATPCFSGEQTESLVLELPSDRHLRELPADRRIETPELQFSSQWAVAGNSITVTRTFVSRMKTAVCRGDVRASAARALEQIRADYRTQIRLTR